jgi:hypothetical protein
MLNHNDKAVRARIVFTGILLPIIVVGPMMLAFCLYEKKVTIRSHLDKAKAVCLTAESISGLPGCEFTPITTTNKDFELSFTDRKSFNQKYLNEAEVKDFYLIDDSQNLLCYTAFLRARKSCLDCHGDPRKSKKLWAQGDQAKTIPVELSGLKEGDICGAYEVIAPLSRGGKHGPSASLIAGTMLLAGISIYAIGFFAIVSYVVNQHGSKLEDVACLDSEIFDFEVPGGKRKNLTTDFTDSHGLKSKS